MPAKDIKINAPNPMKRQIIEKSKKTAGVMAQPTKTYLSPLQKSIKTGKIESPAAPKEPPGLRAPKLKVVDKQQVTPNVGEVWSRKVEDKVEQVIITMFLPGKNSMIQFVAKAAFDHGDMCNTWSMGLHPFLKTFRKQ